MKSIQKYIHIAIPVLLFNLFAAGFGQESLAETRYVSDMLIISVRDGQNLDDPVVGYLPTATPVEVLEETDELMRIRTEDGLEGWVRKKFIVSEKPKAIIIEALKRQISELEANLQALQAGSEDAGLKKMMQGYQREITAYQEEVQTLKAALRNAEKAVASHQDRLEDINAKYQALKKKQGKDNGDSRELASLKTENQNLKNRLAARSNGHAPPLLTANMKWFLIGGGVLILGFVVGRAIRRKPRYGY